MRPGRVELLKKAQLWISFGDKAKLRITNLNNCSGHNHQKIEAMMICWPSLFFEVEEEKGCLELPLNLKHDSVNDISSLRLVLKDLPLCQIRFLLCREQKQRYERETGKGHSQQQPWSK